MIKASPLTVTIMAPCQIGSLCFHRPSATRQFIHTRIFPVQARLTG